MNTVSGISNQNRVRQGYSSVAQSKGLSDHSFHTTKELLILTDEKKQSESIISYEEEAKKLNKNASVSYLASHIKKTEKVVSSGTDEFWKEDGIKHELLISTLLLARFRKTAAEGKTIEEQSEAYVKYRDYTNSLGESIANKMYGERLENLSGAERMEWVQLRGDIQINIDFIISGVLNKENQPLIDQYQDYLEECEANHFRLHASISTEMIDEIFLKKIANPNVRVARCASSEDFYKAMEKLTSLNKKEIDEIRSLSKDTDGALHSDNFVDNILSYTKK